jgi:hypothetical protein
MKSISAHVKNGQIVPDEPIELYDGDAVKVLVQDNSDDEMTAEGRAELEAEIEEGIAEIERGEFVDAHELVRSLFK